MEHIIFIILELIVADIVLGGDNAIVIALATSKLEPNLKKKASLIGAGLAIMLRVVFVVIVMLLENLHIVFLNIVAGGMLVYIALGLLDEAQDDHNIKAERSLGKAVKTIVVADAIMSLDNAIIIATIATSAKLAFGYEILLVIFALLFSFPIILFGASILSKLMTKYKFVVYIFSLLLIHTALHMILKDPILKNVYSYLENGLLSYSLWLMSFLILMIKVYFNSKKKKAK